VLSSLEVAGDRQEEVVTIRVCSGVTVRTFRALSSACACALYFSLFLSFLSLSLSLSLSLTHVYCLDTRACAMDAQTHGALYSLQLTDLCTNARLRGFFDVHPRARNRARSESNGRMVPRVASLLRRARDPCERAEHGSLIVSYTPVCPSARDELLPVVWHYCLGVTRSG